VAKASKKEGAVIHYRLNGEGDETAIVKRAGKPDASRFEKLPKKGGRAD
jgi:hypothetical protein